MGRADELRAELEVLDLEAQFVAAKENGEVTQEMKHELRDARRSMRERREGSDTAAPATIETTADLPQTGGAA